MKHIIFLFLILTQISFAQSDLDHSGFSEIRLGKSYNDLKKRITVVEAAPDYSWFAPMTIEYFMTETGEDSRAYYEMLETDRLIAESLNTKIIWCTFKKKQDANFFKFPIECAQLVFTDNKLIGMILVFDENDMTPETKAVILKQIEDVLGEPSCYYAATIEPQAFTCFWNENNTELLVSDAIAPEEAYGETLHITIGSY